MIGLSIGNWPLSGCYAKDRFSKMAANRYLDIGDLGNFQREFDEIEDEFFSIHDRDKYSSSSSSESDSEAEEYDFEEDTAELSQPATSNTSNSNSSNLTIAVASSSSTSIHEQDNTSECMFHFYHICIVA